MITARLIVSTWVTIFVCKEGLEELIVYLLFSK
jgi:hypothetical protein